MRRFAPRSVWLLCAFLHGAPPQDASGSFLLQGGTVHTVSGPVIKNGSVLVRDGRIIGVGQNLTPPEGVPVIDVRGHEVYPGMMDSAARLVPEHRPGARANGITAVVEMPAADSLVGPMKLLPLNGVADGTTVAVHLRFPAIVTRPLPPHEPEDDDSEPDSKPPIPFSIAKRKYERDVKELNALFDGARRYRATLGAKGSTRRSNVRFDLLLPVLNGELPLVVTAVREREIREAIAWAAKLHLHIVLADAYESYKVVNELKAANIPVILGPTYTLPPDPDDPYDRSYTTAGELAKAGVRVAIASFSARSSRNVPYQAAAAVPFGLSHDDALRSITLNAADILGLGKRLGSIDEGKTADLIVTDGDPLESRTTITMVFIDGKPVNLNTRQKELYEKYNSKP